MKFTTLESMIRKSLFKVHKGIIQRENFLFQNAMLARYRKECDSFIEENQNEKILDIYKFT
jgi:hypothetical protein